MNALVSRRTLIRLGLSFAGAMVAGISLRLDAAGASSLILSDEEREIVGAISEVYFPEGEFPVGATTAHMVDRVDNLLFEWMPVPHRTAFRYVLRALEWGTLAARGIRFSHLPVAERAEVLETWADPTILPRRVSSDGLRLVFGMAFFSHPTVLAHIGWREGCGGAG
jgi:hypothetical protein